MAGFFPMFLRLAGRLVVVVGGGDVAVRTVETLLRCDAEVRVITPAPSPAFARFRGVHNFLLMRRGLQNGDLEDALLALAVDDDPAVNLQAAFLSPPVAMSAFYLKGVSPSHVTLNQIFAGMMPYMLIVILCMILMYVWPGMTLWLPTFLYGS